MVFVGVVCAVCDLFDVGVSWKCVCVQFMQIGDSDVSNKLCV